MSLPEQLADNILKKRAAHRGNYCGHQSTARNDFMIQQPTVKLGEILQRSTEMIEILPDESYKEITVKLWGKGVVLRGIVRWNGNIRHSADLSRAKAS